MTTNVISYLYHRARFARAYVCLTKYLYGPKLKKGLCTEAHICVAYIILKKTLITGSSNKFELSVFKPYQNKLT